MVTYLKFATNPVQRWVTSLMWP